MKFGDRRVFEYVTDEDKRAESNFAAMLQNKRVSMTAHRTLAYTTAKAIIYEKMFVESKKMKLKVCDNSGQFVDITDPKLLQRWVTNNENHRLTFNIMYAPFEDAANSFTKRWSIESETMRRCGFEYTTDDDKRVTAPNGRRNVTGGGCVFLVSIAIADIRKHANYYRKKEGKPILSALQKSFNKDVNKKQRRKLGDFDLSLVVTSNGLPPRMTIQGKTTRALSGDGLGNNKGNTIDSDQTVGIMTETVPVSKRWFVFAHVIAPLSLSLYYFRL